MQVSYDDAETLLQKVNYANSICLGGQSMFFPPSVIICSTFATRNDDMVRYDGRLLALSLLH
jgi:hypothetical protein